MDYKTLIILIVMLLLIILAYRELTSFKEIFYEVLDSENKKNTDIMQNSLIKFAGQIKAINNDNLQHPKPPQKNPKKPRKLNQPIPPKNPKNQNRPDPKNVVATQTLSLTHPKKKYKNITTL